MNTDAIVPIERVRSRDQRFRCERLHAVLSAKSCVLRQEKAFGIAYAKSKKAEYPMCASCPEGQALRRRLPKEATK